MLRLTILRLLAFLGILVVISSMYIGYHFFYINYYLFGAHDAGAYVEVWLDKDGDGDRDDGEPPLEGVFVWAGYPSAFSNWEVICGSQAHKTDEDGKWYDFFPGGTCDEIHILVKPPEGYKPTTALAVNGCSAEFGFAQESSSSKVQVLSAEEYIRRQVILDGLKRIFRLLAVVAFAAIASVKLVRPKDKERISEYHNANLESEAG